MSGKSHQKKRNAGLLMEFLVHSISQSLVQNDAKRSSTALRLIRKHFKPGTELYREFRLINSLVKTTVSSEAVAASILQEAKAAARSHDASALDREKSLLIGAINKGINDPHFFDAQVNEYRILATVQTLVNDWRTPGADLARMAQYEDQLVKWLVAEKAAPTDPPVGDEGTGTARLLMKVMMQKLNEKYSRALSGEQKQLLRAYAFSAANDDPKSIKMKLEEVRDKLLADIDAAQLGDSSYVAAKLAEARSQIAAETLDAVDDDTVTRFMLYTKLRAELAGEE